MSETTTTIRVEGIDAGDTGAAALALRDQILNTAIEKDIPGVSVRMSQSVPDAQDASGDILHIVHTGVLTALLVVESVKLWRETRRDKALIIEAKHGSAIRVEMANPDAAKDVEQAVTAPPVPPTSA